jgi:hypothetical protein
MPLIGLERGLELMVRGGKSTLMGNPEDMGMGKKLLLCPNQLLNKNLCAAGDVRIEIIRKM